MAAPSFTTATSTTETTRGAAVTTAPVPLLMVRTVLLRLAAATIRQRGLTREAEPSRPPTALEVPVKRTIRQLALTFVAHRRQGPMGVPRPARRTTRIRVRLPEVRRRQGLTEARRPARRTTQRPEPMALRVKPPTPTGITEARLSRRMVKLRTPSIKLPRKDLREEYKLRRVPEARPRRAQMAISGAVGQTANGNKYAAANGNVYKNTGNGWTQTQGTPNQKSTSGYSGANSTAARGYGGQGGSSGSSAFGGGGNGWQTREASTRGSASRAGAGARK